MHTFGTLGAAQGRDEQVRLHTRQGRRGGQGGSRMKPTQQLHDLGQSLWLDNITRTMLGDGTLAGYIDELSVTGLTSNPTIFDKAISGGDAYDEQIAEVAPDGRVDRGASSSSWRSPTCATPTDLFAPRPRAHRRRRRLLLAGGLAADRRRHRGDDRAGRAAARQGRAREPLHQDPRHRGRPAGDRGVDLRRDPDQRHPALRHRAVPGRRRRLHEGDRAADRGRARPRRRLGRLDLHEPLGRRGHGRGAGRAEEPARAGGRLPRLPRLPRAARLAAHAAADERGRPPAAAALGEHRDQGPRGLRHPLHRGLRLAVHGQHDARADPARLRRPRRGRRPGARPTAATATRCWPSSRAPGSTSRRSRRASRRRARRPSTSPGTTCSKSIETEREKVGGSEMSVAAAPTLREGPAWKALEAHFARASATPTCATSSPPTPSAASGWSPTAPASTSTSPRTGSPTRR